MKPVNWGWRKYECGVPLYAYADGMPLARLFFWPAAVSAQLPRLNRWERLSPALVGFVSRGLARPHACAYSASKALEVVGSSLLSKTWIDAVDAVEAYEYLQSNLLGVWLGDRTPYLITVGDRLEDILKKS